MSLDLDRLENLARACPMPDEDPMLEDWYDEQHLADGIHQPADRALIAAASPDVVLDLIERVRTAEAERPAIGSDLGTWTCMNLACGVLTYAAEWCPGCGASSSRGPIERQGRRG